MYRVSEFFGVTIFFQKKMVIFVEVFTLPFLLKKISR